MIEINSNPEVKNTQPEMMDTELTVGQTEINFEDGLTDTDLVAVEEFKNGNIFGKMVPF